MNLFALNNFDTSYLSKLNYLEIRNLCQTDKQYFTICDDNTILRQLIYKRNPKISIIPDYDIAVTLKQFYTKIDKLFTDNFNMKGLPDYIIPDKFKYTHTKNLINYFIDDLCNYLDGSVDVRNGKIEFPGSIKLNKFLVGVPFSSEYTEYTYDDAIPKDWEDIPNEIILSELIISYIRPSIENLVTFDVDFYRIDYYEIFDVLCSLFLISF
jgi:hypothetical protein